MQVTFITTILYAKAKFCICCTKVNTDFFSDASVLSLISPVSPSPNTKKLFFWLLVWDDELLSKWKITTFLANSLPNFHKLFPSNAIPLPSLFLANMTVQNKQFLM